MNELIKISYETENPTVSARDLHEGLEIDTPFKKWIDRMCEYGFEHGKTFGQKCPKVQVGVQLWNMTSQ